MKRRHPASRAVILMLLMLAALATSSCDNGSGVGVGAGPPARWGGSTGGPPIFVGGPSLR